MTTQAGWHPDPGAPHQLRYWDGERWTEHTAPYPDQATPSPSSGTPAYGGPAAYGAAYPYTQTGGKETTTPDGAPLASWWHRVGASVIDSLILLPILAVLWIPFYGRIVDTIRDYLDEVDRASRTGAPLPSSTQLQTDLLPVLALMTLVSLVFSLVWTFAWLRAKQATPGKLAAGLRVRRRDDPVGLPYGVIARRWGVQYGVQLLGLVPLVGGLLGLFSLLDVLWAAWDSKRQCLHDKAASTNVVRVR